MIMVFKVKKTWMKLWLKLLVLNKNGSSLIKKKVDEIFHSVASAASRQRVPLAKLAVANTGKGIIEDKVIKNHFASEFVYNKYKNIKTVDVVERDVARGYTKIAEPVGPICAFVPITNPTATVLFKSLISLKTRNCIVFSPHPAASECSNAAAKLCIDEAIKAGAPEWCISYLDKPTRALSTKLLHHPEINFALATGGPSVVHACYESGTPAIGVGAGNAPALVDETCDLEMACSSIFLSKTFDNGMICAAEQAVVVVDQVYEQFKQLLTQRGAYILPPADAKRVGDVVIHDSLHVNSDIVGQSAIKIASMAGVEVPDKTLVLVGEASEVGDHEKWSFEKLSPVMALYRARDFEHGVDISKRLAYHGGQGHSSAIYTNPNNLDRVNRFEHEMPTYHVIMNSPSTFGAIGDVYNFNVDPSLTLGCGSLGGNSVSVNVGPENLLSYKTVAEKRENMQWMKLPPTIYFKRGIIHEALKDLQGVAQRVLIITDPTMKELGIADQVEEAVPFAKVSIFEGVLPEPSFACIRDGIDAMERFKPDTVIALGGGSPLDAAKVMRLLYECPEVKVTDLIARFLDIRKRINPFPLLGTKIKKLIEIPTTSGTGAEMTPFAVITGDDGYKYPVCSYALTPDMAIVDPEFAAGMPKTLTAHTGYDVMTHAVESYVSVMATDYTQCLSSKAVELVNKHLANAVNNPTDMEAREGMHNASAIAGIAFANAFLGINHSMAHALGARFHIPHGLCNALVMSHVILYNASTNPTKMTAFPQYKYPQAKKQYAQLADVLGLAPGGTEDEKLIALVERLEQLKVQCGIPLSIADCGIDRSEFMAAVPALAEHSFDDQCTGANPRYPLIKELEELFMAAYEGSPLGTEASARYDGGIYEALKETTYGQGQHV
mmetsp:Transcript_14222/g.17679  ORF Transcript_14222/g.17679 Transcript_14222/m.17679 type:complete len:892 (+) Transcript_14222:190-2865(+)